MEQVTHKVEKRKFIRLLCLCDTKNKRYALMLSWNSRITTLCFTYFCFKKCIFGVAYCKCGNRPCAKSQSDDGFVDVLLFFGQLFSHFVTFLFFAFNLSRNYIGSCYNKIRIFNNNQQFSCLNLLFLNLFCDF